MLGNAALRTAQAGGTGALCGRRDVENHPTMRERAMRIFVGNLAWATTEDELRQFFEPYGIVADVRIVRDHGSRRSRGYGFVEMPDATEAHAAMEGLNGTMLGGRTINISEAHPREEGDGPRRSREERRPRG